MIEPSVSIILVNYNNVADTIECVESLRKLSYANKSIIVVDNGSTDSSQSILVNKYDNLDGCNIINLAENNGFSAGNNVGIQYALKQKTDYILLLNNDTLVSNDFLRELISFQESQTMCDVAIGKIYYADEPTRIWYAGGKISKFTSRIVHERYGQFENESINERPKQVSFATGCCMCLRAEIIETVGLLDEDFFLYDEDSDYCCRIAQMNKHIYYVPTAKIYHKISASTGKSSPLSQYYMARNHFLLIKKNYTGFRKKIAFVYTYLLLLKRCLNGEISWNHTVAGIKAYYRGEIGKHIEGK